MSSTACHLFLKMKVTMAAANPNSTAVALTGLLAAIVSFQWHSLNFPPEQNANSALRSLTSARHFSGSIAIDAVTIATF